MSEQVNDFRQFARDLVSAALDVWEQANQEYSSDDAWTSNFDYTALLMRLRGHPMKPRDAAMVYLMKSLFSIAKGDSRRQSMRSRYIDAINYLLMMAHMDEHNHDTILLDVEKRLHYDTSDDNTETAPNQPKFYVYDRHLEILLSTNDAEQSLRNAYQRRWQNLSPETRQTEWESFREFMAACAMATAVREFHDN